MQISLNMRNVGEYINVVQLAILYIVAVEIDAVQRFIELPRYTEVNPGEDALLKCRISDKKGICSWQKDNKDALSSPPAALVVRVPPRSPRLLFNGSLVQSDQHITVPAGTRATVVCEVRFGNPPAYIEWYLEKDRLISWSQINASEIERPRVWAARSVLEIGATRSAHSKQLSCRAHHPSYPQPFYKEAYTMLDITSIPVVSILGVDTSGLASLEEGYSTLSLDCKADGNPKPYAWWTKEGQAIATNGPKLTIAPVTRNNSGIYGCQARNYIGTSDSVKIEIDVKFPPRVTWVGPDTVVKVNLFSQVTLQCKARGNPLPLYQWYHSTGSAATHNLFEDSYLISSTPQMQLYNVTYNHRGRYVCTATNYIGLKERCHQSEAITLNVLGPPMSADAGVAHGWSGSEAKVQATVCADPPPRKAYWMLSRLDIRVPSQNGRYTALEKENVDGCYRYTLSISTVGATDELDYVLHVANDRGVSSYTVSLTVHESAHVAPLIAGALVIAVLLVLMLYFIIRCRRRRDCIEYKTDEFDGHYRVKEGERGESTSRDVVTLY